MRLDDWLRTCTIEVDATGGGLHRVTLWGGSRMLDRRRDVPPERVAAVSGQLLAAAPVMSPTVIAIAEALQDNSCTCFVCDTNGDDPDYHIVRIVEAYEAALAPPTDFRDCAIHVEPDGGGFRPVCRCGWVGERSSSVEEAGDEGNHHEFCRGSGTEVRT